MGRFEDVDEETWIEQQKVLLSPLLFNMTMLNVAASRRNIAK
jgi:hypothetical protein